MSPRTRKALWILFGILLVASLFLAGPAHQLVHHGDDPLGTCDVCHLATLEVPAFEPLRVWLVAESVEFAPLFERIECHVVPDQGHARAPPRQG